MARLGRKSRKQSDSSLSIGEPECITLDVVGKTFVARAALIT